MKRPVYAFSQVTHTLSDANKRQRSLHVRHDLPLCLRHHVLYIHRTLFMNALVDNRSSTLLLHKRPQVLLSGNGRMMQGTFDIVTQNLLNLGACPIEKLADSPKTDLEGFELPYVPPHLDLPPGSMQPPPRETPPVLAPSVVDDKEKEPFSMEHVAQLHQTCQQTFGNSEPLKFEFIEEEGPDRKFFRASAVTQLCSLSRYFLSPSVYFDTSLEAFA